MNNHEWQARARSRAEAERIIAAVPELRVLSITDRLDGTIATEGFWRMIAGHDAAPISTIEANHSNDISLTTWTQRCVELSGVSKHGFLSLGGVGYRWIEVEFDPDNMWVSSLWRALPVHEFILIADDKQTGMAITEEEHEYQCHRISSGACSAEHEQR